MSYPSRADLKHIPALMQAAPHEGKALLAFHEAARREDGAIPPKYRELISLAVALTTQCGYCLDTNVQRAKAAGVTKEELAEMTFIAGGRLDCARAADAPAVRRGPYTAVTGGANRERHVRTFLP